MEYRTRADWGASYDVSGRALMLGLPVSQVFVHHNVIAPTDDPNADMERTEQTDIVRFKVPSYSWGIHPSGVVLEGMGLHRGAHTIDNNNNSFNNIAFGLMFMGDFRTDVATDAALAAAGELLALQEARGNLTAGWVLRGHRDVYSTVCPGDLLYARLPDIRALVAAPQPQPSPEPEDTLIFNYVQPVDRGPAVYLCNIAAKPRPFANFADAEYWAAQGGHKVTQTGPDTLGPDGQKQTRKGTKVHDTDTAALAIFGF